MPIFIFNPKSKLFSIMLMSSLIYPVDSRTLIVRDIFCIEYKLVFDDHQQLHDMMVMLCKEKVSYVYCDYYLVDQSQNYTDTQERDIDRDIDDLEIEL